jgi:hypothetical protein
MGIKLGPLQHFEVGLTAYCAKEMPLLKAVTNKKLLSEDVDISSHTAWKTPPASPTGPKDVAQNSKGWLARTYPAPNFRADCTSVVAHFVYILDKFVKYPS